MRQFGNFVLAMFVLLVGVVAAFGTIFWLDFAVGNSVAGWFFAFANCGVTAFAGATILGNSSRRIDS